MSNAINLAALPRPLPPAESLAIAPIPLKLTSTLPSLPPAITSQPQVTFTVIASTPEGELTLQLPTGERLTALTTSLPPPPAGTRLSLPLSALQQQPTPTVQSPTTLSPVIFARPLPPSVSPSPSPSPTSSLPANTPSLTSIQPNIHAIINAITANSIPNTQISTPQGPLNLTFKQIVSPVPLQQPTTLTLTSPTQAQLTTPTQTLPLPLATPSTLPLQTPLPITFVANPVNPAQPLPILTEAIPLPAKPGHPQPATPFTPPALSTLRVLLTPGQTVQVPQNTPLTARVLAPLPAPAPQPGQPTPVEHPILLASGHRAVVQSPIALPVESTLVVEFSTLTGPAAVLRLQPANQQGPQAQAQPGQTPASPTATLTAQAPPPVGTAVQGTLTGQTPQGQVVLTISQPAQFAGQTIALNIPTTLQAQLPTGTTLSAQINAPGSATLVSFNLPPTAQRAFTLTHLTQQWGTLTQALSALQAQAPATAQALRNHLPQLAYLLPGLAMLTESLHKNTADLALGKEAATLLRAMGLNFSQDISHLAQLQQPQTDTQWRGLVFPYIEAPHEDPRQGGFFWRREKKDDPRAATATRFVLQLELSQMGGIQLDGLITYPEVWLKLRRHTEPEPGFIENLQTLVASTLEAYGLTGAIAVKVTQVFPIDPMAEILATSPNPLPASA